MDRLSVSFWMSRFPDSGARASILAQCRISYYAYAERLDIVKRVDWSVCELPEAVELGRRIAIERGATRLTFTTEWGTLADADCLFTAGALQFIEPTLDAILAGLAHQPEHLLVNKLCLADSLGLRNPQTPATRSRHAGRCLHHFASRLRGR